MIIIFRNGKEVEQGLGRETLTVHQQGRDPQRRPQDGPGSQSSGRGRGVRPGWWHAGAAMLLGRMFGDAGKCCVLACRGEKGDERVMPDGLFSQRSRNIC